MARVTKREWYRRVNAAWPATVPPLTDAEAIRAAKRLYRFAMKRTWQGEVKITTGNRYTWIRRGVMVVNPSHGWKGVVHLLSHYAVDRLYPDAPGHGGKHARLELRMIKEVVRRGWLDGKLAPSLVSLVAPPRDRRADRIAGLRARLARWQSKERRAVNAIRKLTRQLRAAERVPSTTTPEVS